MPLVRRKKVVLHDLPDFVTAETATSSSRDVFYITQTGEIFPDYESYSARMAFYSMKVFQCELTGKSGLDYFQALDSERSEAQTLHSRFPSQLKAPVLTAVQWRRFFPFLKWRSLVESCFFVFQNRNHGPPRPSCGTSL